MTLVGVTNAHEVFALGKERHFKHLIVKASFLCFKVQCHLHNRLNLINLSRE